MRYLFRLFVVIYDEKEVFITNLLKEYLHMRKDQEVKIAEIYAQSSVKQSSGVYKLILILRDTPNIPMLAEACLREFEQTFPHMPKSDLSDPQEGQIIKP